MEKGEGEEQMMLRNGGNEEKWKGWVDDGQTNSVLFD
jgi:uncharacterized protein YidB (DUF937 family)